MKRTHTKLPALMLFAIAATCNLSGAEAAKPRTAPLDPAIALRIALLTEQVTAIQTEYNRLRKDACEKAKFDLDRCELNYRAIGGPIIVELPKPEPKPEATK